MFSQADDFGSDFLFFDLVDELNGGGHDLQAKYACSPTAARYSLTKKSPGVEPGL